MGRGRKRMGEKKRATVTLSIDPDVLVSIDETFPGVPGAASRGTFFEFLFEKFQQESGQGLNIRELIENRYFEYHKVSKIKGRWVSVDGVISDLPAEIANVHEKTLEFIQTVSELG